MATCITYHLNDGQHFGSIRPATIPHIRDGEEYGDLSVIASIEIERDDSRTCGFAVTLVEMDRTAPRKGSAVWPIDAHDPLFESFVTYCESDPIAAEIRDELDAARHSKRAA